MRKQKTKVWYFVRNDEEGLMYTAYFDTEEECGAWLEATKGTIDVFKTAAAWIGEGGDDDERPIDPAEGARNEQLL